MDKDRVLQLALAGDLDAAQEFLQLFRRGSYSGAQAGQVADLLTRIARRAGHISRALTNFVQNQTVVWIQHPRSRKWHIRNNAQPVPVSLCRDREIKPLLTQSEVPLEDSDSLCCTCIMRLPQEAVGELKVALLTAKSAAVRYEAVRCGRKDWLTIEHLPAKLPEGYYWDPQNTIQWQSHLAWQQRNG